MFDPTFNSMIQGRGEVAPRPSKSISSTPFVGPVGSQGNFVVTTTMTDWSPMARGWPWLKRPWNFLVLGVF